MALSLDKVSKQSSARSNECSITKAGAPAPEHPLPSGYATTSLQATIDSKNSRMLVATYLTSLADNCILWREVDGCNVTRPFFLP